MKILFTGAGSGGHFYPLIAVAEAINDLVREKKLLEPTLYYAAPDPYDKELLLANNIQFVPTAAGKIRRYFSPLNIIDWFKTSWGVLASVLRIFFIYPDVVFAKGGYGSFPMLLAARIFRIPVVIHESDSVPGMVNKWAGRFAEKIAVSYPEAAEYFPKEKVALTGNPIRKSALIPAREGAYEFLKLEKGLPVILVLGGSQGAQAINEVILSALPQLVEKYQIIHQTGEANFKEVSGRAKVALINSPHAERYKPFGYLNELATRMSAGAANLIVTRAGSALFEVAAWGVPSIVIPLEGSAGDHQIKNAFTYARAGGGVVIEQNNLTPGLLVSEIGRIVGNPETMRLMSEKARGFARVDAAKLIAQVLLDISISHES
ncbi:MAG: UDP-N-acetylglucosamine--N-acetylmuramyl-(pentapeptide) pyrophosphoryl-undecaprenol N-acetylglucosamine transferase [Patescibacteria group bacterium]